MDKIKTLFFYGGEIHDAKGCAKVVGPVLKKSKLFDVTEVAEDLSFFTKKNLKPFELVVFYYTVGKIADRPKNALLNHIAQGAGYAGIHSAADSFRDCPEYRAMVGGHFVTHPHFREYQVSVADAEHRICEGLPMEFLVEDEQYVTDYDPRNHILCSALWKGMAMPVAWTKPWGKGRVFYCALGHNPDACRNAHFHKLFIQGAQWAGTAPA